MKNRHDDLRAIRAIDDLASTSPRRMFALSPNDVLVQIALPLVLILAILTRLMIVGQTMANQDRGPVILEMWKQQLILRIERVLQDWEKEAQLPAFPDFGRIQWDGPIPGDERFQVLSRAALDLDRPESFALELYHRALRYRPPSDDPEAGHLQSYLLDLYDPSAPFRPDDADLIPPEFVITPERRAYALNHIADQLLRWERQIENLQWKVVAEASVRLPFETEMDEARVAAQMRWVAETLADAGYPLLRRVREEFERPEE